MSETNTDKTVYRCIGDNEVAYIARPQFNAKVRVVMLGISDEEEKQLLKKGKITVKRDNLPFNVELGYCYYLGEFDFKNISKNTKAFWNDFFDYNTSIDIPCNWDFDTNTYTSTEKIPKWFDTRNPEKYLPYLYASIGKPKKVAIFKETMPTYKMKR